MLTKVKATEAEIVLLKKKLFAHESAKREFVDMLTMFCFAHGVDGGGEFRGFENESVLMETPDPTPATDV